jgi:hypothetical protein
MVQCAVVRLCPAAAVGAVFLFYLRFGATLIRKLINLLSAIKCPWG